MGAKIKVCKKNYENIEFNNSDHCPISGELRCKDCNVDTLQKEFNKAENT